MQIKPFYLIVLLFILALAGGFIYLKSQLPKMAYIDVQKVFNEFKLTKEMETKFKQTQTARQKILDNMATVLNSIMVSDKGIDRLHDSLKYSMKQDYYEKRQRIEEDNQALLKQYNEEIYKQINQYVKDYGKQNGYTYILGAEGTGALMYARETNDISDNIIKYINSHYDGTLTH